MESKTTIKSDWYAYVEIYIGDIEMKKLTTMEEMEAGDIVPFDEIGPVKIMALKDNYVMVRRKGCVPFVVSMKDLLKRLGV